jgi:hypothetical protein
MTDVRADGTITPTEVDVPDITGRILGGTVRAKVTATKTESTPWTYEAETMIRDVDLQEVGKQFSVSEEQATKLGGVGNVNVRFNGTAGEGLEAAMDSLKGSGEFEVLKADFWEFPVLKRVAEQTRVTRDVLTVGEAAGIFKISDRFIHLHRAAISAPVLGMQGTGKVGFNDSLDLSIVAAPLADWRDKVKQTRIPIVSDVAGEVIGGVQKILNTATSKLLYEFRVTGTIKEPEVRAVPTPVLSDAGALLFGKMLPEERRQSLLELVRGQGEKKPE